MQEYDQDAVAIVVQVDQPGVVITTVEPASAVPITGTPDVGESIVGIAGEVLSTISPVRAPVLVFPLESVTVIVVSTPSNQPLHTTPVQSTFPLAGVGLTVQIIPGIVTLVPGSTPVRGR
jgi:hypothetical protein